VSAEADGRDAAERFRAEHGLGVAPIWDLAELAETVLNVDIARFDMPDGVEGATRQDPLTGATAVAIGTSDNPERQRFTLAHEIAHIVCEDITDHPEGTRERTPGEQRADAFARHLLAPLEGVRALVAASRDQDPWALASAVIRHFGVSPVVASIQLKETGAVSVDTASELRGRRASWYATYFGWDAERKQLVREAQAAQPPRRIVANATAAYIRGDLSAAVLARVKGERDAEALEAELRSQDITPQRTTQPSTIQRDEDW
jgi:Zn-dependent peptidase ImmA (M78 family)